MDIKQVDMDKQLEKEQKMTINEIFKMHGEAYFRQIETALLKKLCQKNNLLISCGGGVCLQKKNISIMKESGTIVYLKASPQTVFDRVKNSNHRPVLNGHMNLKYIEQLMNKRVGSYERASDITICVDHKTEMEICKELLANDCILETGNRNEM